MVRNCKIFAQIILRYGTYNLETLRPSRPGRGSPSGPAFILELHRLADDADNGVRRLPAHPLSGMGVGVQSEACGVMAQGV